MIKNLQVQIIFDSDSFSFPFATSCSADPISIMSSMYWSNSMLIGRLRCSISFWDIIWPRYNDIIVGQDCEVILSALPSKSKLLLVFLDNLYGEVSIFQFNSCIPYGRGYFDLFQ